MARTTTLMGEASDKAEATRQAIVESAARVFRRDGYAGARLSDIAAEIGMKAGSLYYYFASREELVEAVMAAGTRRTRALVAHRLAELPVDADHRTRIAAAIETHFLMVIAQEDISSATIKLIWEAPQALREKVLAEQRSYGNLWRDLLTQAREAGALRPDVDLSVVRMAIMGALNWAADWFKPDRKSPEAVARDITTMILGGLTAPTDPSET